MNLIDEVLKLKAKVSEFRRPRSMGEARDQRDVCSAYTEMCCTAAPKLARMLSDAITTLWIIANASEETMNAQRAALLRLTEIEKELAP